MANPTPAELKAYIRPKIEASGYSWPIFEKQIQQESGWEHYRSDGSIKMSYTNSSAGVGQLNKRYYHESVWSDPYKNINAAADTAIRNLGEFGTYRKALAAYNWGPGNVGGYTNEEGVHPAWDGTRGWVCPVGGRYCATEQRNHYLDTILGVGWPEPSVSTPGAPAPLPDPVTPDQPVTTPGAAPMTTFNVYPDMLSYIQSYGDEPATDEMYYKHDDKDMYSEVFGVSGNRYCYIFSTGKRVRFSAD